MPDPTPRIEQQPAPEGPRLRVLGQWTAAQFAQARLLQTLGESLAGATAQQAWDLSGADQLDHVGAQLLWDHWGGRWPAQLAASPAQRAVLERVARFTVQPPIHRKATWRQMYLGLGAGVLRVVGHFRAFVRLIGQLALNLGQLARAPHEGPWRDLSGHLYRIGATSLPITALVGFLIGVVLAYLTSQQDAMRVMGISHSFRLVMPRAMALAIAMPLISVWTTLCALAGGMLAADVSLGITPTFFMDALPQAVSPGNLGLASAKSVVFGVLIALIGCHFGLRVKPNTQSLGEGTTASVVTSITVVILVDALFAVLFKDVGI
jgi:phospholipid/cholesterol/gamma-HCH transport system permease protein